MSKKMMYVIHAYLAKDNQPDWIYATASTREGAEALAREDVRLGLITDDWDISEFTVDPDKVLAI